MNEPETSLHPDLLPALARLISEAASHTQIIVVSHANGLIEPVVTNLHWTYTRAGKATETISAFKEAVLQANRLAQFLNMARVGLQLNHNFVFKQRDEVPSFTFNFGKLRIANKACNFSIELCAQARSWQHRIV